MKQIENIFSKEKQDSSQVQTPNPKIPIIIDTREKQSLIASCLREQKANIKFEHLQVADYIVGEVAIERKTFSDFVKSMINKRLLQQLIELSKYPKHFLIIEGFDFDYCRGGGRDYATHKIHENAVRGMFLSTILDFKIPIIFTENQEDTSNFLISVAKKQEKSKTPISFRASKTLPSLKQQKQFILEGFPGIGPTSAKKLLDNFSSLQEIFNASKEQLRATGLNESTIEKFRNILKS